MEKLEHYHIIAVDDSKQEDQFTNLDLYTVLESIDNRLAKLNSIPILEAFVKNPEILRAQLTETVFEECLELVKCCQEKLNSTAARAAAQKEDTLIPAEIESLLSIFRKNQDFEPPTELMSQLCTEELSLITSIHSARYALSAQLQKVEARDMKCALKLNELREIIELIKFTLNHTRQCSKLWKYAENTPLFDYRVLSDLYRTECFELSMLKLKLDMVLTKHERMPKIAVYEQEQQEYLRMENDYLEMLRKEIKLILLKKMSFLKWRYEVRIVPKYWQRFRHGLKKRFKESKSI